MFIIGLTTNLYLNPTKGTETGNDIRHEVIYVKIIARVHVDN